MHKLARHFVSCALVCAGAWAVQAHAASVSFFMNQSNALPDGVNYLEVTVQDVGTDVQFTVTPLSPLTSSAGSNFGIQAFGFNTNGLVPPLTIANLLLPGGWSPAIGNQTMDGFGRFDVEASGTGSTRQAFFCGSTPVPVPAAVWLFGSGLIGLIGIGRRKKTTTAA